MRWPTDCTSLCADAGRDGHLNAEYGTPADGVDIHLHLLDGLPRELIRQCRASGRPIAVSRRLITGFERDGRFYTRARAAATIDNPDCVP